MKFVTKSQLQDVVEYMGENIHVPQLVQHFDRDNIYSTDEKLVGCWIDGRPLYQKVINCEGIPNTNIKTVSTGLANANIKKLFGYAERTSDGTVLPLNYMNTDGANKGIQIQTISNGGNITIRTGSDLSAFTNAYIVIQYTKTTDAANSFNLADENDYSTTEHIVGTWIDDKPVYQKTITGIVPTTSADGVETIGDFDIGTTIDNVIKVDAFVNLSSGAHQSIYTGATIDNVYKYIRYFITNDKYAWDDSLKNKFRINNAWTPFNGEPFYATIQYTKTTD